MIFANAGIALGVYLGTRFWKKRKRAHVLALDMADGNRNEIQHAELINENKLHRFDLAEDRHQFRVSTVALLTTSAGHFIYPPISVLNIALISYGATPILDRAVHALQKQRRIQNDVYSAMISLLCIGCGQYFAAAMNGAIYHLSNRKIRENRENVSAHIHETIERLPTEIWVLFKGVEIKKPLAELCANEIVIVSPGELIPVSGNVLSGCAVVDQQVATGETQPIDVVSGDQVLAQSLVISGRLHIRAATDGETSQSGQLHQLMRNTRDYKTRLQLKGEAWADRAALPAIIVSAAVWPVFGLLPATALLFSLPANSSRATLAIQTLTCIRQMSQQGILVRDGRVLEEMPWIDVILFDKTGTLTESTLKVLDVCSCSAHTEDELLRMAAAVEQHLKHPVADALRQEAELRGMELPEIDHVGYEPGCGVQADIAGRHIHVGNSRFIHDYLGVNSMPPEIVRFVRNNTGHSYVYVAMDGKLIGAIELRSTIRAETIMCISNLRKRGFRNLQMVSGDTQEACEYLNQQLHLDACYGGMLPEHKAALIRHLQSEGHRVCFIGDGLNDIVAMRQANVSVALASAAETTCSVAQLVLVKDELTEIHTAMDMAMALQLTLTGELGLWIGFGMLNAISVSLLHFTPLQSGILFGGAFEYLSRKAEKPVSFQPFSEASADVAQRDDKYRQLIKMENTH